MKACREKVFGRGGGHEGGTHTGIIDHIRKDTRKPVSSYEIHEAGFTRSVGPLILDL